MPFTKPKGRPRKYATVAESKAAAREKRLRYEEGHVRERARRSRGTTRSVSIDWNAPEHSLQELQDDELGTFAVPSNARLATLYRRLKNIHVHVEETFHGGAATWFATTAAALLQAQGKVLEGLMSLLQGILSTLEPYFRAMDIVYDTYAIFFSNDTCWGDAVTTMGQEMQDWRKQLCLWLDAYNTSTTLLRSMLSTSL